jgi:hypothetical protein
MKNIFGTPSDLGVLEHCGFTISGINKQYTTKDDEDGEIMREDQMADLIGTGSLQFGTKRLVRNLYWLRGWPYRMVELAGDANAHNAQETLASFKRDLTAFRSLEAEPSHTVCQSHVLKRSIFKHTSVQQFVEVAAPSSVDFSIPYAFTSTSDKTL